MSAIRSLETPSRDKPTCVEIPVRLLEIGIGAVLAVVGFIYFNDALALPPPFNENAVGAGRFPIIVAAATLVSVALMVGGAVKAALLRDFGAPVAFPRPLFVCGAVLLLVLECLLFEKAGALACTFTASLVLMVLGGERRPLQFIGVPALVTLGIHVLFTVALGVRFP